MPIIRSAIKKMRKDKVRTLRNKRREDTLKKLVKEARRTKTAEALQKAFSALDKTAKVKLIHKNKANRIKARLSKLLTQPSSTISKQKIRKSSAKTTAATT